jgi:hypothetical protein
VVKTSDGARRRFGLQMSKIRPCFALFVVAVIAGTAAARANHSCDAMGEEGWSTLATHEVVNAVDGRPYQADRGGDWFADRTTTTLPFCNYINASGNYSLRSYSLSPEDKTERVVICRAGADGASVAVPPYKGSCPPK